MVGQGGEFLFNPDDCRHPIPSQMKELKQVLKEWALGVRMYQKNGKVTKHLLEMLNLFSFDYFNYL